MKENRVVYLVEGETEKKFIKSKLRNARNKKGVIYNGSVHLFNPYQDKSINKVRRHLGRNKTTILVIDTDLRPNNKYYENLECLIRESKTVKILKQKENFEDEMSYIIGHNTRVLFESFQASSKSEFTRNYLAT